MQLLGSQNDMATIRLRRTVCPPTGMLGLDVASRTLEWPSSLLPAGALTPADRSSKEPPRSFLHESGLFEATFRSPASSLALRPSPQRDQRSRSISSSAKRKPVPGPFGLRLLSSFLVSRQARGVSTPKTRYRSLVRPSCTDRSAFAPRWGFCTPPDRSAPPTFSPGRLP